MWAWLSHDQITSDRASWRGQLLAGLIKASVEWDSLDAALQEFYSRRHDLMSIRQTRANAVLTSAPKKMDVPLCSPKLFDRHVKQQQFRSEFSWLSLFHPTTPDADPLLQYMREEPEAFSKTMSRSKRASALSLSRAAFILRLGGRIQDAEFIESTALDNELPIPGFHHSTLGDLLRDPRLKGLCESSVHLEEAGKAYERLLGCLGSKKSTQN